jgi:hypothetical protein
VTRPVRNHRFARSDTEPGVYILCPRRHGAGKGAKRCGSILIAKPGESFYAPSETDPTVWVPVNDIDVALHGCPEHGPLTIDRNDLVAAVAKARKLNRAVPLRASPVR